MAIDNKFDQNEALLKKKDVKSSCFQWQLNMSVSVA